MSDEVDKAFGELAKTQETQFGHGSQSSDLLGVIKLICGILFIFGAGIVVLAILLFNANGNVTTANQNINSLRTTFDQQSKIRTQQLNTQQNELTELAGNLKTDTTIITAQAAEIKRLDGILTKNNISTGTPVKGSQESPPFPGVVIFPTPQVGQSPLILTPTQSPTPQTIQRPTSRPSPSSRSSRSHPSSEPSSPSGESESPSQPPIITSAKPTETPTPQPSSTCRINLLGICVVA